ncbi:nitrite reductase small subunit NirD [Marinibaculum pumilum]|uniref:Nitrite reductase small subunit NirD n=1 Tax=Marinibaculum pumilum TaxID=1766165 RepID=A0ABV7L9D7_9PROT
MNGPDMIAVEGWTDIGALAEIPRRGARRVRLPERTIAVFRTADDEVHALEDRCPHKGGPLSQGIVHDCAVTCPLHNLVVDLATGAAREEDGGSVPVLPVRLHEGRILLDLRAAARRAA